MRALSGAGKVLTSPFRATRSAANFIRDSRQYGTASAIGQRLGFRTDKDYGQMSKTQLNQQREGVKERENYRKTGSFDNKDNGSKVRNSISGPNNGAGKANNNNIVKNNNQGNANNNKIGNKMVEMQILNGNKNKDK